MTSSLLNVFLVPLTPKILSTNNLCHGSKRFADHVWYYSSYKELSFRSITHNDSNEQANAESNAHRLSNFQTSWSTDNTNYQVPRIKGNARCNEVSFERKRKARLQINLQNRNTRTHQRRNIKALVEKRRNMETGKSENEITTGLGLPVGVTVLADLGYGIVVAKVEINLIREQDKNAHLMKPEMFRQLHENIKKRGGLESLPLCALTDKIEVISGHHRLRASKEAGLKEIIVLLDITGLTRSQIAAKQLAHNAINGFDDPSMLKEIAKMITDVDDMIESFIGKDVIGEPLAELEKLLAPMVDFEWKQVQLVFLPHQVKDLELLVSKTQGNVDYIGAAYIDQYEQLMETLSKYQNFKNVKNLGTAIHSMITVANAEMEESEYDGTQEWVTLSRLFGSAAIPQSLNETMKKVFEKMKKEGEITEKTKWKSLEVLAKQYLQE